MDVTLGFYHFILTIVQVSVRRPMKKAVVGPKTDQIFYQNEKEIDFGVEKREQIQFIGKQTLV